MASLELSEAIINERDHEIQQIAKSIEELAQIFKELAVLVIDQVRHPLTALRTLTACYRVH